MPTVQIYGNPLSTCTKRVMATCKEIGVDIKMNLLDFAKGDHKDPEYIQTKQPFGAMPAMVDEDGTQLYESRAICRYLTAKYGKDSGLLPSPTDLKAYGLFEQAASVEYSAFDPPAAGLTFERIFVPMMGRQPNEQVVDRLAGLLNTKLDAYEIILSKQKYLAGDNFTLADLFHLPYGGFVNGFDEKFFETRPNVKKWWEDISSRPSWKALN